jgi:hypothetical protein
MYRSKEKCVAKPTEGEFKPQYIEEKKTYEHMLCEGWFPVFLPPGD